MATPEMRWAAIAAEVPGGTGSNIPTVHGMLSGATIRIMLLAIAPFIPAGGNVVYGAGENVLVECWWKRGCLTLADVA